MGNRLLFKKMDHDGALSYFEKALKLNNPRAHHMKGVSYCTKYKDERQSLYATPCFEKAFQGLVDSAFPLSMLNYKNQKLMEAIFYSGVAISYGKMPPPFPKLLCSAIGTLKKGETGKENTQLVYACGKSLYWYVFDSECWNSEASSCQRKAAEIALKFYCSQADSVQRSIFSFLSICKLRWRLPRVVARIICKIVWTEKGKTNWIGFDLIFFLFF
jgi:hypothetical protein